MAKARSKAIPRLSAWEMEIMDVLWERGAVTLSEAHQSLSTRRPIGYTTVQTRLNRLVDKGVVGRSGERPARYEATVAADAVGVRHLDLLLDRVRGCKIVPLVAHLVKDRALSPEEIGELKRLIAEAEEKTSGRGPEEAER